MKPFKKTRFFLVLFLLALFTSQDALAGKKHKHHGKHGMGSRSIEEYIRMFESPDRLKWQMPGKIVDSMGLEPGNAIADIGAGSGYFSTRFSKKVGEKGKVYAVDVEKGMVDYIETRIQKEGIKNMETILCEPDDPLLPTASLDFIFICDTLHHIENREAYMKLAAKSLKTGGRLVIVDFKKTPTKEGPPMGMRISWDDVVKEITSAGYYLEKKFDFLPDQYFLIFRTGGKKRGTEGEETKVGGRR